MNQPVHPEQIRPRVLVIDDDIVVLRVLARMLGRRYSVLGFTSAAAALGVLDAGVSVDAILCDVLMPGMTGVGFLSAVERRHPELVRRIVFITGELGTSEVVRFLDSVDNPRLQKPWDPEELDEVIAGTVRPAA